MQHYFSFYSDTERERVHATAGRGRLRWDSQLRLQERDEGGIAEFAEGLMRGLVGTNGIGTPFSVS